MPPIDLVRAVWILFIFTTVFFFAPIYLTPTRESPMQLLRVVGNFVRALLAVAIVSVVLSRLKIFNATTMLLLLLLTLVIAWVRKRAATSRDWLTGLQEAVIGIVRFSEGQSRSRLRNAPAPTEQRETTSLLTALRGKEMLAVALVVVVITTGVLFFAHSFRELRLDQPEQYEELLRGRELMLNLPVHDRPVVFPSVVATIAFLSSADPMDVTRFLTPVFELFLVLAAGLLIFVCTRGAVTAIAAVYCLGTAAFQFSGGDGAVPISAAEKIESLLRSSLTRTRGSPEFEIGLLCVVLTLAFLTTWLEDGRDWDSLVDAACCVVIVAVASPFLLLVCMIAAGSVLLRPVAGIAAFVLVSYGLATYGVLSGDLSVPHGGYLILALAAVLGVGCLLGIIESRLLVPMGKTAERTLLFAYVAVAVLVFRPHPVAAQYLEYEKAARETQVIADRFPRQTWAVVAPIEQLAETLGLGGYEDLANFVEKYKDQAANPEFRIPDVPEDLFIYVEKTPFQFFSREPQVVPMSVLADSTYRSYRSPAGRASLESAALRLCESYQQSHGSSTDIFYEDQALRIYHLRREPNSKTGTGG